MRIKRIKISDYILLEDRSQYDFLIRYADMFNKPENVLKLPPVEEMPFGFVKETQSEIMQGITLGREIWNIVDVIVGIGLILSIWVSRKKAQR